MFIEERDEAPPQLNERLMMEFLPGLGKSALCDRSSGDLFIMNGLEKIIQLVLEGTFNEVHEEKNHVVERQQPIPYEIFF